MEENKASKMAVGNVYLRGYHATYDAPRIFDDFLAYQFLTGEERLSFDKQFMAYAQMIDPARAASFPDQAAALAWLMQSCSGLALVTSRARYTEDRLQEAISQGIKQYVILGAGIDTFAFRRKELMEQLQVIELDHPATQDFKRRRLAELEWEIPANLHFVPIDFTCDNLASVLKGSSFDSQALSFFSWQGVSYYLTRDEVFATLRSLADVAPTGSMVIFDYLDTDAFDPEKVAPRVLAMQQGAQQVGEPMKSGFDPDGLAAELAGLGLHLQENLSPAYIEERYFTGRTDNYHAFEHFNFACAVVK